MDDLSQLIGGLERAGVPGTEADSIGGLAAAVREDGGLDALLAKLQAGGLGDAASSWVGPGPNQSVDPQQLGDALGPDTVNRLSAGSGMSIAQLLPLLAAFLPQIIDMLTPDGAVPSGGLNSAAAAAPGDHRRDARRAPRRFVGEWRAGSRRDARWPAGWDRRPGRRR